MKGKFQYSDLRDKELLATYKKYLLEASYPFSLYDIVRKTVNTPCSRFWVSGDRLQNVMGLILKGDRLENMHENKREMFFYLAEIIKELKKTDRYKNEPMCSLCEIAVEMEAPKFFLKPSSAKIILHYALKRDRQCKKQKSLYHRFL